MSEEDVLFGGNYAGSDYRELLLKRAKDSYVNGDIKSAIFYQIKSLCTGFESRFNNPTDSGYVRRVEVTAEEERLFEKSPLLSYAIEYLKGKKCPQSDPVEDTIILDGVKNTTEGIQRVQEFCASLPEEWTVIQLCKEQRNDTTFQTFREIFGSPAPIYLSILKHARSKEFPEPICLRLTAANQASVFERFSILTDSFTQFSTLPSKPLNNEELESYWNGMCILESRLNDAVAQLKQFMGPWSVLFVGNARNVCKERQEKIFKIVDKFCAKHSLNEEQQVLLSLLSQQRYLLTQDHIMVISRALSPNEESNSEWRETATSRAISEFLKELPSEREITFAPCILIIDERIDHFYWEVLNPMQELCRMSSFHILVRLYERYKSRIKNGYLMVDVERGRCVINPDCNLPNMEERMRGFFNYWLPKWKCTYNVVPKPEDFMRMFEEADCYVYCGHGSGLQYLNGRKISKFQMKCIVFLFGCDSVRLRSQGLHSEMVASHLYYHSALCPVVVGTLQLGLDFQVDKIATNLLSEWIPPNTEGVIHWHHIDKHFWKKGTLKPLPINPKLPSLSYDGSLARAVAAIHDRRDEKLYNTVGFVYRGLPAWNAKNHHANLI